MARPNENEHFVCTFFPFCNDKACIYLSDWIFHDKNIGDCAKLAKVISKLVRCCLPRKASNKEFSWR